jgi:hypothetical protein
MHINKSNRESAGAVLLIAIAVTLGAGPVFASDQDETVSKFHLKDIPFDGRQAYEYLRQICAIGPRPSGSPGMAIQQRLVADHFRRLGAQVGFQEFTARNPRDDSTVPMANMIVQWHPDRSERILL